jgi:hypothetical protein
LKKENEMGGHVEVIRKNRNTYKILVGKPEGNMTWA